MPLFNNRYSRASTGLSRHSRLQLRTVHPYLHYRMSLNGLGHLNRRRFPGVFLPNRPDWRQLQVVINGLTQMISRVHGRR